MTSDNKWKSLDYREMGSRIRKRREELHLTREAFADKIDVSSKFISDVEYGEKGVSIKRLYLIMQVLDISSDYILAGRAEGTSEEARKDHIRENIIEPLNKCTVKQLECMEKIVKYYIEALKGK